MIDTQSIRRKILDAAVRGQLSEQLIEDGTSDELLEQITMKKVKLQSDRVIKKTKPLPPIKLEDAPFDIPDTWKWVHLDDITSKISSGSTPTGGAKAGVYVPDGAPFIREQNVYNNGLRWDGMVYITEELLSTRTNSTVIAGDILLNITGGSIGRCSLINDDFNKGSVNQHILIVRPIERYTRQYIHLYLCSPFAQAYITGNAVGDKDGFSGGRCKRMPMPLPPLEEQIRIVERTNELLVVLAAIDEQQMRYSEDVSLLRSKIIEAGICGQLTEQLSEDGSASELYDQIQLERSRQEQIGLIKEVELLPEIESGEEPFDIPASWMWTRFGNTSYIVRGGSPRPIKQFITDDPNGINWIKIGDVEKGGKYIFETKEKIIPEGEAKSRRVSPGDFLLTNSMSFGRPYISKIEGCIHDGWLLIRNLHGFDDDYLYYLLSSTYMYNEFCLRASGSTVDNLNIEKVSSAFVPLPPISEQRRIVERIDELLSALPE